MPVLTDDCKVFSTFNYDQLRFSGLMLETLCDTVQPGEGLNGMNIRDAVEGDLPAIVGIYNATIPYQTVTADLEPVTVESRLAWFHAHTPEKRPLWVLEAEGKVVAWLGFQSFYGRPAYEKTAELSIYVDSNYRQKGIGRMLVQRAIAHSPGYGIKTLLGFIFAENLPSLRLFEQLGFQRWGYLPRVAEVGNEERDLVIMGLQLSSG